MAETTAVRFRRGTKTDHDAFTGGLNGEITAQVGNSETNTIWVHEGDGKIGTPMARADMKNVDKAAITVRGIADYDLHNIQIGQTATTVRNKFNVLGYAQRDGSDMNTTSLTEARNSELGPTLAKADLSNVNTANLATSSGHSGKNLAYADLTNVTTNTIINKIGTDAFIKIDGTNANTTVFAENTTGRTGKNLAYADLSNVKLTTESKEKINVEGIQLTDNLVNSLDTPLGTTYPSTVAVKNALDAAIAATSLPEFPTTQQPELVLGANNSGNNNFTLEWKERIPSNIVSFNNIDDENNKIIPEYTDPETGETIPVDTVEKAIYSLATAGATKEWVIEQIDAAITTQLGTISTQLTEILS